MHLYHRNMHLLLVADMKVECKNFISASVPIIMVMLLMIFYENDAAVITIARSTSITHIENLCWILVIK